jgi:hypothetical protein
LTFFFFFFFFFLAFDVIDFAATSPSLLLLLLQQQQQQLLLVFIIKTIAHHLRSAHVDVPAEMQQSDQHGVEGPIVESRHARRSSVVAFVQHVHAVTETE